MTNHRRIVLLDICFIFVTIAIWFRFSFHNWKCENTSFIVWTVIVFYWFFRKTLDHWFITWLQKIFSNLCPLAYSYLDCAFGSVWLLSLWAWRFTGYIWSYESHDWLWSYMLWSLLLWALDSLIIWDFLWLQCSRNFEI